MAEVSVRIIVPADSRRVDFTTIYEACMRAHVPVPTAVHNYFGGLGPHPLGEVIYTPLYTKTRRPDGYVVYSVDLARLRSDVRAVEFVVSEDEDDWAMR